MTAWLWITNLEKSVVRYPWIFLEWPENTIWFKFGGFRAEVLTPRAITYEAGVPTITSAYARNVIIDFCFLFLDISTKLPFEHIADSWSLSILLRELNYAETSLWRNSRRAVFCRPEEIAKRRPCEWNAPYGNNRGTVVWRYASSTAFVSFRVQAYSPEVRVIASTSFPKTLNLVRRLL
jgi:hypothetical protein